MIQKLLHFVQRGRILLRCGSAFALSLPSLGVSSLDLGRLLLKRPFFLETVIYFLVVIPGCATGSRECAPDDRLRADLRCAIAHLRFASSMRPGMTNNVSPEPSIRAALRLRIWSCAAPARS